MNEVMVGGEDAAATGGVGANNRSGISAENRRSRFEGSRRPSALAAVMVVLTGVLAYCAGRIDGQLAERERVVGELRAERINLMSNQ